MAWIELEKIRDGDMIRRGTAFRLLPTKEGIKFGNYIPEYGLDYILIDLPGKYMCLSCISKGEEGNTMSYLKKSKGNCVIGKEVKKMLVDKIQRVLINKYPDYVIR